MTRWIAWHPRAGSLRRFLLLWLLGGLWLTVAAITLWHTARVSARLAQAQDERLAAALVLIAQGGPAQRDLHFRVSTMDGEWMNGNQALVPFPWRATLHTSGTPDWYVSHVGGVLMRAAAMRHTSAGRIPADVVVQTAAPLSERFPGWKDLWREPLPSVYAMAAAMTLIIASGVVIAMRWLDRARVALDADAAQRDDDAPSELSAAVQHVRELQRSQHRWVDEQRRFLADASHQLRTPMAVLRTQLQSAIAGDVAPPDILPQMLHTVDRAAGLANQLLSVTKLEQLKQSGELTPVDLKAAARDAVLELSPLIAAKRLDFALEGPALRAPGDTVMLGELLRNLLANAIHHAPPAGRLGVLLRDGAGRIELVVWDEGPGVDDGVRPRLFQAFTAGKGGVGLGLSICRQIAEAMGASVHLYNRIDNDRVIGVDAVVAWGQGP